MICEYCRAELDVDTALRTSFEDRLIAFDMGLNRYSKLCKQSPSKRHAELIAAVTA